MQVYVSVSYIQNTYLDGTVSVVFIAAKSRVAPLKDLTAQRLELSSAVLGLRLSNYISRSLQITLSQHHFWTDSQNVIYWVNGNSSKFKPFVAHRVEEIQRSTLTLQWKHLPGAINPADIATRGITSEQLIASETWINRPWFLYSGPWQRHVLPDEGTIRRKEKRINYTCSSDADVCSYTTQAYPTGSNAILNVDIVHCTAWVLRFVHNLKRARGKLENCTAN